MTGKTSGVRLCYEDRLEARRAAVTARAARTRQLANARLAVFALGIVAAALSYQDGSYLWAAGAAAVLFLGLVLAHDSAKRQLLREERAADWYERALDRLDYRFAGRGHAGDRFADPDHPYATHLDLFGRGSLFEFLSLAHTAAGEETLARWLLQPAPANEVRARQSAVAELRPMLDLREKLARLGPEFREGLHPEQLVEWGSAPAILEPRLGLRIAALALPCAGVLAASAAIYAGSGVLPLLAVLSLQGGWALLLRRRAARVLQGVERPARELARFVGLLELLESERFSSTRLVELRAALDTEGISPSRQVARLGRLVTLLDSRRNQLFALVAPFLLWGTQLAFALERWRLTCGPHLAEWIQIVGDFEALSDLASYAYERPEDPFPEIQSNGPRVEAEGLGHPLLSEDVCVRNDLCLDPEHALLVVSGSNMSGKSTLLRSVGTSVVMGLAGAPVRARRLCLSPLSLGASLRIQDSLLDGVSRFYAEITCLKGIVAQAENGPPLVFLLDEILQGTNSHDRRIGATELVRGLVNRGALGLITTHDLALTEMVDELAPRAHNTHFEDQLVDGQMSFDYKLRDGIVTRGNALALMRAVGLNV